jgi:hypothetical protein
MKYAVDMELGAMIYISSLIKIGTGIQKFIRGDTQEHRQQRDLISVHLFLDYLPYFQKNKVGL